jgi:hypothetical protein
MTVIISNYNKYARRAFYVGAVVGIAHFPEISNFVNASSDKISEMSPILNWFFNPYVTTAALSIGLGKFTGWFGKEVDGYNLSGHRWHSPKIDTPYTKMLNGMLKPKEHWRNPVWNLPNTVYHNLENSGVKKYDDADHFNGLMESYHKNGFFYPVHIDGFDRLIANNLLVEEHLLYGNGYIRVCSPTLETLLDIYGSK